jgi:hypothetical protein
MRSSKGDTAQLQADAAAYGIILEPHHVEPEKYLLWPEHADAVDLFLRCMTQWRASGNGVIGLDYGVVLQLASLYGIRDPATTLEELQVMELHARDLINKQAEKR